MTLEVLKNEDVLVELQQIICKTVKDDPKLVNQILFNGLSAFTPKPYHLMINDKTSEGKSYPALQISQYFPSENVWVLGSATPQAFKYERGIDVDDNFEPIEDYIEGMENDISELKRQKNKQNEIRKYEKEIRKLKQNAKTLIDLRNRWIIFTEPPHPKLIEMLYSTLSSDKEFVEHKLVNKSSSGRNTSTTVVLRGTPSVLICTARDESTSKRWEETHSRFSIVSPKSSPQKYRSGMELIGKESPLETL